MNYKTRKKIKFFLSGISVLTITIFVFIIGGCLDMQSAGGSAVDGTKVSLSEPDSNTAKIVSGYTNGPIGRTDDIEIYFNVELGTPNEPIENYKDIISFNPKTEGKLFWKSGRVLAFSPESPWPINSEITVTLNVPKIKAAYDGNETKPVSFTVKTEPLLVTAFTSRFVPVSKRDTQSESPKDAVMLQGTVTFNYPVKQNNLDSSAFLRDTQTGKTSQARQDKEKTIKLNFVEQNKLSYGFTSDPIEKGGKNRLYQFVLTKEFLNAGNEFVQNMYFSPDSRFSVRTVFPSPDNSRPGLVVEFSEELDWTQPLEGLISVNPGRGYEIVRLSSNQVLITGPFEPGAEYTVTVQKGVRSASGAVLDTRYQEALGLADIKPQVEFLKDGVFLTSAADRSLFFRAVNVHKVNVEIHRVFENNLIQFLQTQRLESAKDNNDRFNYGEVNRVGVSVHSGELELESKKNNWKVYELELKELISPEDKGLYLVYITFSQDDINYQKPAGQNFSYYDDPTRSGYYYRNGRVYKPVITSDIGVTWKKLGNTHTIAAADLLSTAPLEGAEIQLFSYQNQVLASGTTGKSGMLTLSGVEKEVRFLTAEKDGKRTVVTRDTMSWNMSTFETEGKKASKEGLRAYLYTDRGVYRPGDTINLSAIIRNRMNTFPEGHPVSVTLVNPRGQEIFNRTSTEGRDGMYAFSFETAPDAPTGDWHAKLEAGDSVFSHIVKVETIVPYRLKVRLTPKQKQLSNKDNFRADLHAEYLFGGTASGLKAQVNIDITEKPLNIPGFGDFSFESAAVDFQPVKKQIFEDTLNENGNADIAYQLPDLSYADTPLAITARARVFESGGRFAENTAEASIFPFSAWVGYKQPESERWRFQTGKEVEVPVVVADRKGNALEGRKVEYKVYHSQRYWWWHWNNRSEYRMRFKSLETTEQVEAGTFTSGNKPEPWIFSPQEWGNYLVEFTDEGGHTSSFFLRTSGWGGGQEQDEASSRMNLETESDSYVPGDTAKVTVPEGDGRLLVTVENAYSVLSHEWVEPDSGKTEIEIPITEEMVPTAYVSVSRIRQHAATLGGNPIRTYGVLPLNIQRPNSRQEWNISTSEVLEPNKKFTVDVSTKDGNPAQFTLAVVDQGILDITGFETPDPWQEFYAKLGISSGTWDMYGHVIGAVNEDIYRRFAIGGGGGPRAYEASKRPGEGSTSQKKRFESVAFFSGVQSTDQNGKASISFTMPNYMGAVRIMVVSASEERYGSAEKTVPVRSDLVMLPTLPRVIGPSEQFALPVQLFAMNDAISRADVRLSLSGPITAENGTERSISFENTEEAETEFLLSTPKKVGTAEITIRAEGGGFNTEKTVYLPVRPSSPPVTRTVEAEAGPGEAVSLPVPDGGIEGSQQANITVSAYPKMNLGPRLSWLIRYPYGCIEQMMSALFPQLFLKDFLNMEALNKKSGASINRVEENINEGITRLGYFQQSSGAFGYWPGSSSVSDWSTNYAGHFMIEAKKLGYFVPSGLYSNWLGYQKDRALTTEGRLFTRVYRVYLLSLAGTPSFAGMNLLKQGEFGTMNTVQKWLLGAAYKLAGMDNTAEGIVEGLGTEVEEYQEFGGTYGSSLRDKAMILDAAIALEEWDTAEKLFTYINERLSIDKWYSTQTTGYSLLALGKYMFSYSGFQKKNLSCTVTLPDGKKESFDVSGMRNIDIASGFGKSVEVSADRNNEGSVYAYVNWSGLPAVYLGENISKNLKLEVEYYDTDGKLIDVSSIEQGTMFYLHLHVERARNIRYRNIEEIALTQILPAGWEVDNVRLSGETMPRWMNEWNLNREEYTDVRDDRVSWFFDWTGRWYQRPMDFVIKLLAVTEGEYTLPPAILEAMYRNDYKAMVKGLNVKVTDYGEGK